MLVGRNLLASGGILSSSFSLVGRPLQVLQEQNLPVGAESVVERRGYLSRGLVLSSVRFKFCRSKTCSMLLACLPYGKQERTARFIITLTVLFLQSASPYTLNFRTSLASPSMLSLFFRARSLTSCTALLICCTPADISCRLLLFTVKGIYGRAACPSLPHGKLVALLPIP